MNRTLSSIRTIVVFILPVILIIAAVAWFIVAIRPMDRNDTAAYPMVIAQGSGVRSIAAQLESAGIIRSRRAFEATVILAGNRKNLKAGTFLLFRSDSTTAIERTLAGTLKPAELSITIPPGLTMKETGPILEKNGIGTAQDFITAASVYNSKSILPDDTFSFLIEGRPAGATLEGYLFPDTYRVYPDAKPKDVIRKMLKEGFGAKVATQQNLADVRASGHSLFEIVTLASIIEKEVKEDPATSDRDRKMVADIFWRRIAMGMALQSDVTVRYATGKQSLDASDFAVDSAYNTYTNQGLPPGPIDSPSLSSVLAAIHPVKNAYLYFLTDANGGVHYATTYEEHLANKAQYLK